MSSDRVPGWITRFEQNHGPLTREQDGDTLLLVARDGALAALTSFEPTTLGVVLLRRQAYAVGRVEAGQLVTEKVGTRHVHGRTAAGGWSQGRYARRRANQADEIVGAVASHTRELVGPHPPEGLVVGGDRGLVTAVLGELGKLWEQTQRLELYDLPDPSKAVLREAVTRAGSARIVVTDAPPDPQ